jgi:hypothetical protein
MLKLKAFPIKKSDASFGDASGLTCCQRYYKLGTQKGLI